MACLRGPKQSIIENREKERGSGNASEKVKRRSIPFGGKKLAAAEARLKTQARKDSPSLSFPPPFFGPARFFQKRVVDVA